MNHIGYLLQRIKREIPLPLLNVIFMKYNGSLSAVPVTLDYRITQDIIKDILIVDMNVTAGKEEVISLAGCKITTTNTGMIYHIGYAPTGGKEIMSILDVGYGYGTLGSGTSTIASAAMPPMVIGTSRVQLVGKNTAFLDGYTGIPLATMRVLLEHDEFLSDVSTRTLSFLAELAVLAAKMYINVQGGILLKNAVVQNGEDLPYLESILDTYSDAVTMYNDKMKVYKPISLMGDKTAYDRYIRSICPQ